MASVNDSEEENLPGSPSPPWRSKRAWTYGLLLVSVVAVAVIVVALLQSSPAPQQTTAPPTSSGSSSSAAPAAPKVVDEPFDPKAAIPGCSKVEQATRSSYGTFASVGNPSYDNPKFPWFNGPKATAMTNALAELLPAGAEIEFASPEQSLVFQPISDYGTSASVPEGSTDAYGSVAVGTAVGSVHVGVQKTVKPIPPCVAGELDERRTLKDGTVVDVHDTWQDRDGVRTLTRSADAYVADGSRIYATADDSSGNNPAKNSGQVPLSVDDLVRIVSDPRLRISTGAPAGTPAPREECAPASPFDKSDGPAVTRDQARKLDGVLASIDVSGRKLPPLQPADFSKSAVCTGIPAAGSGAGLDISITGGQSLPAEERPDPASSQRTFQRLPDGTVVQTLFANYAGMPIGGRGGSTAESTNYVIVTHPGGTQVSVTSRATAPNSALPLDRLQSIALTTGLEL